MMKQENTNNTTADILLANIKFEWEKIFTWNNGEFSASEILSRFQNETVVNALNILKKSNRTLDLLYKVLEFSYINIWATDKDVTVNAYLKDLSDPNFLEIINWFNDNYKIDKSHIIIEILEDNYWELNQTTLNNIKELKKMWFRFSIDDLTFYEKEDDNNISLSILITLLENDIIPDFVKIDGPFLQKILNNEINEKWVKMFKNILDKLKTFWIQIVWEWIQDEKEWEIAKNLWIDLFQWRELEDSFSIDSFQTKSIPLNISNSVPINEELNVLFNYFKSEVNGQLNLVA
jgi:EAL domain-containing protein (putative c-di-GMP-specific phosphodiesterase class I)